MTRPSSQEKLVRRPTGGWQIRVGLGSLALAGSYIFLDLALGGLPLGSTSLWIALYCIFLASFFMFWGSVLRALWFLPGDEVKQLTVDTSGKVQ